MKLRCKLLGCRWDRDHNPTCKRCGRELRAEYPGFSGSVYLGWGRYGWVQQDDDSRAPADVQAELRRINSLPSWRP